MFIALGLEVGLVGRLMNRPAVYSFSGRLLFSVGVFIICFLVIRMVREAIDMEIEQRSRYILLVGTLSPEFPPATPVPTHTPVPLPTATPLPQPAIRLSIPGISLNSAIKEISPMESTSPNGEVVSVWESAAFAVGHYVTSGNPGEGRNIVLTGHNNILGEVFRHLDQLNPGDGLVLFTEEDEFHYVVQKKYIIPYVGAEEEGNVQLLALSSPQSTEIVTLISCWPYATNANRIIIIAVPFVEGG